MVTRIQVAHAFVVLRGGSIGGLGGLQPPYNWCINGNMGRVREKKRWRKEEKGRERERKKRLAPLQSCSASTIGCTG